VYIRALRLLIETVRVLLKAVTMVVTVKVLTEHSLLVFVEAVIVLDQAVKMLLHA
jgi:hypothetical protein